MDVVVGVHPHPSVQVDRNGGSCGGAVRGDAAAERTAGMTAREPLAVSTSAGLRAEGTRGPRVRGEQGPVAPGEQGGHRCELQGLGVDGDAGSVRHQLSTKLTYLFI